MKTKLLSLALICWAVSGCDQLPAFPTIEIKLVDAKHEKIHKYELPKRRGEKAPYIGSVEASFLALEKHFCMSPSNYSKLEDYISDVEDIANKRCK